MLDTFPSGFDAAQMHAMSVRPMVLSDDADNAAAGLAGLLGQAAVLVTSPDRLSTDWPDYVVARARTGGALVAEGARESGAFMRLAEGRLDGRPAVAGLIAGTLVFLLAEASAVRQAA